MDEPSSALDPRAEHALFQSIRSRQGSKTTILITHRLANIIDVDQIFVMQARRTRQPRRPHRRRPLRDAVCLTGLRLPQSDRTLHQHRGMNMTIDPTGDTATLNLAGQVISACASWVSQMAAVLAAHRWAAGGWLVGSMGRGEADAFQRCRPGRSRRRHRSRATCSPTRSAGSGCPVPARYRALPQAETPRSRSVLCCCISMAPASRRQADTRR